MRQCSNSPVPVGKAMESPKPFEAMRMDNNFTNNEKVLAHGRRWLWKEVLWLEYAVEVFSAACDTPGQCMTRVKSDELQVRLLKGGYDQV